MQSDVPLKCDRVNTNKNITKQRWSSRMLRHIITSIKSKGQQLSQIIELKNGEQAKNQVICGNNGQLRSLAVRGMTVLEREKFHMVVNMPVLDVCREDLNKILPLIQTYRLQSFKNVSVSPATPTTVPILLDPSRVSRIDHLPANITDIGRNSIHLRWQSIELNYGNWKAGEVFAAVLPVDQGTFRSYSRIGHIIHVNLRQHLLPYKHLIGQVLLDKFSGIRSVINKSQIIDNTFRNFQFEVLAGAADFIVSTKENGIIYEFDFSHVYWNPRLVTEHERISKMLGADDVLYDVFSGVGPFSIPCAKRRVNVLANDLNPEAVRWLQHNSVLNKVTKFVRIFNKDGRQFIQADVRADLIERWNAEDAIESYSIHFTMNLPKIAPAVLDVFHGLMRGYDGPVTVLPIVHVYCFVKECDKGASVAAGQLVEEHLGHQMQTNFIEIRLVRSVAPNKHMYCVSFQLTREILFA